MPTSTELGIDEAGRGPILGPLVLAGVLVPSNEVKTLENWGVADSKQFGSHAKGKKARAEIADNIKKHFEHRIISVSSKKVDHYVQIKTLNVLEQEIALQIISELQATFVVLDGANLFKPIVNKHIRAVNQADRSCLSVAAASILAKHTRDLEMERLFEPFTGDFGSIGGGGYANQATLKFVNWHIGRAGELPDFYRKSYQWKALNSQN